MKHRTTAALCCTVAFLVGCEKKAAPSASPMDTDGPGVRIVAYPEAADMSGKVVTTGNSAQYSRDCEAIDTLHFSICATPLNADGSLNSDKPRWQLYLSPKDANIAHEFLRKLLADYPLHQPFSGQQARYSTDEDHYLCFFEQTSSDEYENVFTIKVFIRGLNFMDIEQRVRPQGQAYIGLAGTQVSIEGKAKADLFSFMATCAEQSGEIETARSLRRIANGALVQYRVSVVLLIMGLVTVSVIVITLLWQVVKRRRNRKRSQEVTCCRKAIAEHEGDT